MSNEVVLANREPVVKWLAERDALVSCAKDITTVKSDSALEVAGEIQSSISKAIKQLEAERKAITGPLDETKKAIMAEEKALVKPLNEQLARIKALTSAYATECARRIEEERRKREEEERKAAEAAVALEDNPFAFGAEPAPAVTPTPVPIASMPKTTFNRMVERWEFEIVDANAVPRELCSPDEKKIRALLASKKAEGYKADQIVVGGLRIFATVQVQSR